MCNGIKTSFMGKTCFCRSNAIKTKFVRFSSISTEYQGSIRHEGTMGSKDFSGIKKEFTGVMQSKQSLSDFNKFQMSSED